jgi:hypothetical protein
VLVGASSSSEIVFFCAKKSAEQNLTMGERFDNNYPLTANGVFNVKLDLSLIQLSSRVVDTE